VITGVTEIIASAMEQIVDQKWLAVKPLNKQTKETKE